MNEPLYTNSENLWNEFKQKILEGVSTFVPSIRTRGKNKLPWIDIYIKRLIRKRDKLFYRQRRTKTPEDKQHCKNIKHFVQWQIRLSYDRYVNNFLGIQEDQVSDSEAGPKQTYAPKKLFTFLMHAKRDSCGMSPLKEGGTFQSTPVEKSNILNRQFQLFFSPKSLSLSQLCNMKVSDHNSIPPPAKYASISITDESSTPRSLCLTNRCVQRV